MNKIVERYIPIYKNQNYRYLTNMNFGKPKLLMLHGINLTADFFEHLFPVFNKDYELFAPDFRGHGKSFRDSNPYDLENYQSDIQLFYDTLIYVPCYCIGMSLGGRVGLSLAIKHPNYFKKLVMVDISPDINPEGLIRMIKTQEILPESFKNQHDLNEFYEQTYKSVSKQYRDAVINYSWKEESDSSWKTSYDRRIWNLNIETAQEEQLFLNRGTSQINIPVLVLRGENSDILSKENALNFTSKLKNGTLTEIPQTGHLLLLENKEKCCNEIQNFIRKD